MDELSRAVTRAVVDMVALTDSSADTEVLADIDHDFDAGVVADGSPVKETALEEGEAPKESVVVGVQVGVGVGVGVEERVAVSVKRADALTRSLADSVGGREAAAGAVGSAVEVAGSLTTALSLTIADGVDGAL